MYSKSRIIRGSALLLLLLPLPWPSLTEVTTPPSPRRGHEGARGVLHTLDKHEAVEGRVAGRRRGQRHTDNAQRPVLALEMWLATPVASGMGALVLGLLGHDVAGDLGGGYAPVDHIPMPVIHTMK